MLVMYRAASAPVFCYLIVKCCCQVRSRSSHTSLRSNSKHLISSCLPPT